MRKAEEQKAEEQKGRYPDGVCPGGTDEHSPGIDRWELWVFGSCYPCCRQSAYPFNPGRDNDRLQVREGARPLNFMSSNQFPPRPRASPASRC
jgi:hypothetical protein